MSAYTKVVPNVCGGGRWGWWGVLGGWQLERLYEEWWRIWMTALEVSPLWRHTWVGGRRAEEEGQTLNPRPRRGSTGWCDVGAGMLPSGHGLTPQRGVPSGLCGDLHFSLSIMWNYSSYILSLNFNYLSQTVILMSMSVKMNPLLIKAGPKNNEDLWDLFFMYKTKSKHMFFYLCLYFSIYFSFFFLLLVYYFLLLYDNVYMWRSVSLPCVW